MPKVFTSKTQKIGEIGEHLAVRYLEGKGHKIQDRNYTKKWGEIDIVSKKESVVHFCEVKTKTVDTQYSLGIDKYRAEDAMHPWKQRRLARTIESYVSERNIEGEWQVDLLVVYIFENTNEAKIDFVENILI